MMTGYCLKIRTLKDAYLSYLTMKFLEPIRYIGHRKQGKFSSFLSKILRIVKSIPYFSETISDTNLDIPYKVIKETRLHLADRPYM